MSWFTRFFEKATPKRKFSEPRFVTYRCHRITCPACGNRSRTERHWFALRPSEKDGLN
jgi:hypothetical protein